MPRSTSSTLLVTRKTCRICGSAALTPVVSLGEQFIGGGFAGPDGKAPVDRQIPLELVRCDATKDENACGLVQLRHSVPPAVLYRSYWYRSGINQTMRNNLASITARAEQLVSLKPGDLVVDIGCNDGTLLKSYKTPNISILGFDPARNIVEYARANGVTVINDFFSAAAFQAYGAQSRPRIITSIAMFYDLENPHAFVADLAAVLARDGVWVLELSYMPTMLEMNSFDTICHEHLEYYSLAPMERLFAEHGLEILDVELNGINGGSFRIFVGHSPATFQTPEALARVQELRVKEFELRLDEDTPYAQFRKNIHLLKKDLRSFLAKCRAKKKLVHGYGASTKGNTILQYCDISPTLLPAISDRNPDKWGNQTVGTNIPIISEEDSRKERPDYYLALPWHFIDEFVVREQAFLKRGGKFIVPMPNVKLVGN
jgi:hypothetical protein